MHTQSVSDVCSHDDHKHGEPEEVLEFGVEQICSWACWIEGADRELMGMLACILEEKLV